MYAPSDPPDALWVFGSRVAAQAVLTVYGRAAACANAKGCCARTFGDLDFWQSWFPLCVPEFLFEGPPLDARRGKLTLVGSLVEAVASLSTRVEA